MALKRQHDTQAMFSMASMTDVIFLLLIFFMVTSTFVFPSALEVNLPQSSQQTALKPSTRIYVDKDMNMVATMGDSIKEDTQMTIAPDKLDDFMKNLVANNPEEFVALYADEEVPYGKIVDILDKGSKNGLKVVLATKPASAAYGSPAPQQAPVQEAAAEPAPQPEATPAAQN